MSKKRSLKYKIILTSLLSVALLVVTGLYLKSHNIAVLEPKGIIASEQRELIIIATALGLLVILPVFIMTFAISWKYRASNHKARYTPDWDHSKLYELIWWGLPTAIIVILSVLTWQSTHQLDPSKQLSADKKPITVQVVALQWKWLFIYPEQNIASINYLQFPEDTPVNFEITADAPMNSFWIPELGGQIYAMPGMSTKLHLMADQPGTYNGSSANLSGQGFAGMKFIAKATSDDEFNQWLQSIKQSNPADSLNMEQYRKLAQPSKNNPGAYYSSVDRDLYHKVMMKFAKPKNQVQNPAIPDDHKHEEGGHH